MALSTDNTQGSLDKDPNLLVALQGVFANASLPRNLTITSSRLHENHLPNSEAIRQLPRQYVRFYSENLRREMEFLVFGDRGTRVLMFPPRMGRFFDYEDRGVLTGLEKKVREGSLQLICVDSIDKQSFYDNEKPPLERLLRHKEYEEYILKEVLPLTEALNPDSNIIAHGCSLGAYHAIAIALRHPQLFSKALGFSGRYDISSPIGDFSSLLGDHFDEQVYYHMPSLFIPNVKCPVHIDQLRKLHVVLAIGEKDPFLKNNVDLVRSLGNLDIDHEFHIWQGRAHRWERWGEMAQLYL